MILPSVSDEDAQERFKGFRVVDVPSEKRYLRYANDPSTSGEEKK